MHLSPKLAGGATVKANYGAYRHTMHVPSTPDCSYTLLFPAFEQGQRFFLSPTAELERLFFQVLKPSSIAADVASLKDTYQAIIDADGGYPPKKYR